VLRGRSFVLRGDHSGGVGQPTILESHLPNRLVYHSGISRPQTGRNDLAQDFNLPLHPAAEDKMAQT
jgi:hypothetical protein